MKLQSPISSLQSQKKLHLHKEVKLIKLNHRYIQLYTQLISKNQGKYTIFES